MGIPTVRSHRAEFRVLILIVALALLFSPAVWAQDDEEALDWVYGPAVCELGTEFASMFSRLGVRVTIVDRAERVLCFLDAQIGEALQ